MPHNTKRPEIDNRTLKLLVGIIATGLPAATYTLSGGRITSISESYYITGPTSTIFTGSLFAIAAFLCAYNGHTQKQMLCSKIASISAILIALYPCDCNRFRGSDIHYAAATIMFAALTYFCWSFYQRSLTSKYPQAKLRRIIYLICAVTMPVSIIALGANKLIPLDSKIIPNFVFYVETLNLLSFGATWLVASRTIPLLTHPQEKFSPFRATNPPD